jgi:transcriptional regulator GlxA family with amidase domain
MRVGVVVFDGFLTSEVTAPLEVFAKASSKGPLKFEVMTVAAEKKTVTSEEGLRLQPDVDFASSPDLDILIVPSSLDVEGLMANQAAVGFIKEQGAKATYLASNCAGAFLLGKAGLLDGRRVTTYIGGNDNLQKQFPKAKVIDGKHIVVDGNLVTSIGGVTTYDATLTMLERITSPELANKVADALYYFPWLERASPGETP